SHLKVILLTSAAVEASPPNRVALDRVLTKPVKHSDLLEAIQSVMLPAAGEQNAGPVIDPMRRGRTARRRLRILVAEDNPINQKLVLSLLKQQRHTVTLANNGQ